ILLHLFPGRLRSRNVGGHKVKPHSRPYAAALKVGGGFGCGGFFITPQWVLLAGHCNGSSPFNDILLLKGDSGGPMVCKGVVEGIVSYGNRIPPGVYSRIADFLPWIKHIMTLNA
ncbi:Granzyme H, partial [Ophiophagus hannah]